MQTKTAQIAFPIMYMIVVPRFGSFKITKSMRVCPSLLVARAAPRNAIPTMHIPASSSTHTKDLSNRLRFTTCMNTMTLIRLSTRQQVTFSASRIK